MKKNTSAIFLALAITATTISAQTGGQIPIAGRTAEPIKTTEATISATIEPKNDSSSEISDYLWTLVSIIRQVKF
ncbi:MAG TPA: hypothetical protein VK308_06895 [Pyrinomonadaceae bacterium]|jgi:hypothetical protein|nr:hypothetical protein [Pyrinomonadaceae bacterium]